MLYTATIASSYSARTGTIFTTKASRNSVAHAPPGCNVDHPSLTRLELRITSIFI